MQYSLLVNEKNYSIEANISENNLQATIDDHSYDISFYPIDDYHSYMIVDGKSVNVYVHTQENGKTIIIDGESYWVQDEDWLRQNETQSSGLHKEVNIVTPPMPAIVISVTVNAGDAVKKGQAVVVVSAMKMETTLVSPFEGVVETVNVKEGDKVMPGDILIDIKPIESTE